MTAIYQESKPVSSRQKYLGDKGLILFIALLSAFAPISTDLYLPALPGMSDYFHVTGEIANLTLILFFIFFSLGMFVWGPLSDKYGRRPILITCLVIYIISSFGCAISLDIWYLIVFRIFQAIGGSGAITVATAIVRDSYSGKKQESVLAVVQSMIFIAPAVAPVLGAFMLPYTSWRGIFWTLTLIGIISLCGALLFNESIPSRFNGTVIQSMKKLGVVLSNRSFSSLLIIFSLTTITPLSFVAASSFIFERGFGVSEQMFSLFFALNAFGLILGPFIYLWLFRHFTRSQIIVFSFIITIIGGALVCIIGNMGPLVFSFALLPASVMTSCVKIPGTFLTLEQQKKDTGSAVAIVNSFSLIFGTFGMFLISFDMTGTFLLGTLNIVVGLVCLVGWLIVKKLQMADIQE